MTINSMSSMYDDSPTKSLDSRSWKISTLSKKSGSFRNGSLTSTSSCRSKNQSKGLVSPYLAENRVKLLSTVTEKKMVHRRTTGFISSFPLAVNIYKANSDEFKVHKRNKKVKKPVAMVGNDTLMPQACTVSDMNDSEYNETKKLRKPKPKKRRNNKKFPIVDKNIEIYDRDARFCSQLNINLDSSSTDMFKHLTGDGARVVKKSKTNSYGRNQIVDNDVWAVLRNINKMRFISSPPMSESMESLKVKNTIKRRQNDTRFIETCRTEEFAYISYDSSSINSCSTSLDRVTVIGREENVKETSQDGQSEANQKLGVDLNQKRKVMCTSNFRNKNINMKERQLIPSAQERSAVEYENMQAPSGRQIASKAPTTNLNDDKKPLKLASVCVNTDNYDDNRNRQRFLKVPLKTVPEKESITSVKQNENQFNGITRIVVSKGKDTNNCKDQAIIRKQRLVTTMPSTVGVPKLTQADIKRRLANIKFPIVVTGRDQLSSFVLKPNDEVIQFSGLEGQIWPFMVNWLPKSLNKNKIDIQIRKLSSSPVKFNGRSSSVRVNAHNRSNKNVLPNNNETRNYTTPKSFIDTFLKSNCTEESVASERSPQQSKMKPMRQFRDKMLNIFCNKSPRLSDFQYEQNKETKENLDPERNKNDQQLYTPKQNSKPKSVVIGKESMNIENMNPKHMWSKGKRASNFIENVIRKVKCGAYYDSECNKCSIVKHAQSKYTQTEAIKSNLEADLDTKLCNEHEIIDEFLDANIIPGFDDTLQNLTLESVTKDQIAVKHCVTNIVVQFDIAPPIENERIIRKKNSLSCVPIKITESQTKIYKCKTTILDSVLPAEICTILPKMLFNIFDTNAKLGLLPFPVKCDQPSIIPTIKEITFNETSGESSNLVPNATRLQKGYFSSFISTYSPMKAKSSRIHFTWDLSLRNVLPEIDTQVLFYCVIDPRDTINNARIYYDHKCIIETKLSSYKENKCRALVPYVVNPGMECLRSNFKTNFIMFVVQRLKCWINDIFNSTNLSVTNNVGCLETVSKTPVAASINFKYTDFLFANIQMSTQKCEELLSNETSNNINEPINSDSSEDELRPCRKLQSYRVIFNNINRKSSFIKLKKKCKSASSLASKRSTPLQKIANLDEFFQALGLSRDISGVIDGSVERKILSSIVDMKNWVSEVTPKQAMLILLLANKKESSNLIRLRGVILHGIAVHRITKASELDMEIEVIERENLNTLPQYDGITYLPASIENQDNLFEELCWIAKTTASDHNRPFDKSSEQLLKSLISKRKKLNPSYLRVMARYVGLGLLKS